MRIITKKFRFKKKEGIGESLSKEELAKTFSELERFSKHSDEHYQASVEMLKGFMFGKGYEMEEIAC